MDILHSLRANARALSSLTLTGMLLLGTAAGCDDASAPDVPKGSTRAAAAAKSPGGQQSVATAATPLSIEVLAPENEHHVGIGGVGWLVDMELHFPRFSLAQAGFNGFQLSGPGGHANIPPFPKPAAPGRDESLPGLVVVCTTTTQPPGTNLAGLFNITGVTDLTSSDTELWATWILAAPACGVNTKTVMTIALVADNNHDGIFNDAPNVVPDSNGDGLITTQDVVALGLASNVVTRTFRINP